METPKIKPIKERDNIDLLNLALELHTRSAIVHTSKEVHEASIEAKAELINRFNDLEQRNRELVNTLKSAASTFEVLGHEKVANEINKVLSKQHSAAPAGQNGGDHER